MWSQKGKEEEYRWPRSTEAPSWQPARKLDLSPTAVGHWIQEQPEWAQKWILARNLRNEYDPVNTPILTSWDPKQRSSDPYCAWMSDPWKLGRNKWEFFSVCGNLLLQQETTNTDLLTWELLRERCGMWWEKQANNKTNRKTRKWKPDGGKWGW